MATRRSDDCNIRMLHNIGQCPLHIIVVSRRILNRCVDDVRRIASIYIYTVVFAIPFPSDFKCVGGDVTY